MRIAKQRNANGAQKIRDHQHSIRAEAIDEAAQHQGSHYASSLKHSRGNHGKRERDSRVMKYRGQPTCEQVDVDQAHEESDPQQNRSKGAALPEEMNDR